MNDDVFEVHRSYLMRVAYRMTSSVADAEDMVQEAYLRWCAAQQRTEIENPRPYLTRVVVRLCLDRAKSAQARRETYVGPWLPDPVVENPSATESLSEDLSVALLLTLERLSPLERAAFLLHDVFDVDFGEVARTLDRSEESCRQLAARARAHVKEGKPRYRASREESERLAAAFAEAAASGDAAGIARLLAEDAMLISDAGGRAPAALRPIFGSDRITRLLLGLRAKGTVPPGTRVVPAWINALPGFIFFGDSGVFQTLAIEIREEGRIGAIYVVRNPDKLRRLDESLLLPERD